MSLSKQEAESRSLRAASATKLRQHVRKCRTLDELHELAATLGLGTAAQLRAFYDNEYTGNDTYPAYLEREILNWPKNRQREAQEQAALDAEQEHYKRQDERQAQHDEDRKLNRAGIFTAEPWFLLAEGPRLEIRCRIDLSDTVRNEAGLRSGRWTPAQRTADEAIFGFWTFTGRKAIERALRAYAKHVPNLEIDSDEDETLIDLADSLKDWLAEPEAEKEPEQPELEAAKTLIDFPGSTQTIGLYDRLEWAEGQAAKGSAKALLMSMAFHWDSEKEYCWYGTATLVARLGISRSSFFRTVLALEAAGLIQVQRSTRKRREVNQYTLVGMAAWYVEKRKRLAT